MDRVEITVRKMLTAIEAPLYDIGVLSHRGMLPGLDSIPAEEVLKRLSLLKYRNARGSHIYIRPSGEHRYTVLDDLNETTRSRLSTDGFTPCAVVETSAGNFPGVAQALVCIPEAPRNFRSTDTGVALRRGSKCRRLETVWPSSRLYQLQDQVPEVRRPLPFRSPEEPTPVSNTQWRMTLRAKSPGCMKPENRSANGSDSWLLIRLAEM